MIKKVAVFFGYVIILFNTCLCYKSVVGDLFSSLVDMKVLFETHSKFLDGLETYLSDEYEKLDRLEKNILRYKTVYELALVDAPSYLENPLNAFTLIKRLTGDLYELEKVIKTKREIKFDAFVKYPSNEDLNGVVDAVLRITDLYNLNPAQLADGVLTTAANAQRLNHTEHFIPMTASDCNLLVSVFETVLDYNNSKQWRMKYQEKLRIESRYYTESNDKHFIPAKLDKEEKSKYKSHQGLKSYLHKSMENSTEINAVQIYSMLCNNKLALSEEIIKRLHCRYLSGAHPFLKLAPYKIEQMYIKPDIIRVYQVISDQEIEHLIGLAERRPLIRAHVWNVDGSSKKDAIRVSKLVALEAATESAVTKNLLARTTAFTGLSMACNKEIHLQNYGVGGYYSIHSDYSNHIAGYETSSNAIATALYYLSDGIQGGATVFPKLGLASFPVRGSALFWHNLHPSGSGDPSTIHSACPVLLGEKWVINSFIFQGCNEFTRPCNLEYQEEDILYNITPPVLFKGV